MHIPVMDLMEILMEILTESLYHNGEVSEHGELSHLGAGEKTMLLCREWTGREGAPRAFNVRTYVYIYTCARTSARRAAVQLQANCAARLPLKRTEWFAAGKERRCCK